MTIPVQWGDQDLFAHVNNAVYFKWMESARVAYWNETGMRAIMEPEHSGPILASISCDFRKQIKFPDSIEVGARLAQLGRTSLTLEHHVFSHQHQAVAAMGQSIVVIFNYRSQHPIRVSEKLREAMERAEGRTFPSLG